MSKLSTALGRVHEYSKIDILLILQVRLEELQAQKAEVVTQKEAADDENRKLVSSNFLK